MRLLGSIVLCLFLLPQAPVAQEPSPDAPQAQALQVVRGFRLSENLTTLAARAVFSTDTYRALVDHVGAARAADLLTGEMVALLPTFLPEWEVQMAAALVAMLAPEVLLSLARDGATSTYADRVEDIKRDLAFKMRERGELIVTGYAVGSLLKAYEKALGRTE